MRQRVQRNAAELVRRIVTLPPGLPRVGDLVDDYGEDEDGDDENDIHGINLPHPFPPSYPLIRTPVSSSFLCSSIL